MRPVNFQYARARNIYDGVCIIDHNADASSCIARLGGMHVYSIEKYTI